MGFNNNGVDYIVEQAAQRKYPGILGISITQNNDTPRDLAIDDYILCFQKVYPVADYISIDVSCPNVKDLEPLYVGPAFELLLNALKAEQQTLATQYNKYVPMAIKVSPDLATTEINSISQSLLKYNIDAIIATNTTRQRNGLEHVPESLEKGGLSGKPLFALTKATVKQFHHRLKDKIPIIATGGIQSGYDALAMKKAGASLVQIYTGLIYQGPRLIREIVASWDKNY